MFGGSEIEDVRATLEAVTTVEGRLAVTAVIVLLTALVVTVVVPRGLRWAVSTVGRRLQESEAGSTLELIDELLNLPFPMKPVCWLCQVGVLVLAGLALLLVWEQPSLATLGASVLVATVPYLARIVVTILLLGGALAGTRLLERQLNDWLGEATHVSAHQEGVVFRVLQVAVFLAAGLAALSVWHIDLGGILVGAGFLGIVLGMAARQTLGSLIAGFVLMFSRPFEIGDWVEINDNEGTVTDITIINTRLRSPDGETVVLPNDYVSGSTVINRSKRDRLRLRLSVGVDYDTDLEHAEAVALETMEALEVVAPGPKPQVVPTAFDDSAITLECRFWITQPNAHKKWQTIRAVVYALKTAFEREGIGIPYPQRTLSARGDGVDLEKSARVVRYDEGELARDRSEQ